LAFLCVAFRGLPAPGGAKRLRFDRLSRGKPQNAVAQERHVHYGALTASFWALFGLFVGRYRRRLPERLPAADVLRIGLATHKLSRLIAKEEVTEFVRAPFTEDPEGTQPVPGGARHAVGRLLTCPYCVGLWVASVLAYAHVLAPREARFASSIFSAQAISDFLHAAFVRVRGPQGVSRSEPAGSPPP
jgi:hypothetical protein